MAPRLAPNQDGNICLETDKVHLINNMLRRALEYFSIEHDIDHLDLNAPERTCRRSHIIQEKTFLRKLYHEWYGEIEQGLPELPEGFVLELGSGGGFLKQVKTDIITSEILHLSNVDVILDGLVLPFLDKSLQGIVMVDVFHHLSHPAQFLNEAARCVKLGGVIIMIEPWYSFWSAFIYRHLHHEAWEPHESLWELPAGGPLSQANSALPWIVFERDRKRFDAEHKNWCLKEITPHTPFRYLLSGGVSMRSMMPGFLFGLWRSIENCLNPFMKYFAMFATIKLERINDNK